MDFKTIVENIFQMEEEMDLFNKKIDGVYFWELVRFSVVSQVAQKTGLYGQAHTRLIDVDQGNFGSKSDGLKKIFYKNPFFVSKSDLLFIGHQRRKLMEDGLWWDIYCDPVIDSLKNKRKCLLYENPVLNTHLSPQKTEKIRHLDFVFWVRDRLTRNRLINVNVHLTSNDQLALYQIERQVKERFGVDLNLKNLVYYRLVDRKGVLPLYTCLLKRVRPKIVIFICSYGKEVFVEACKNLCIPSVELQHGVIGRYHTAYSFVGQKAIKSSFPDYFLAFGDYWKAMVDFPIPEDNVFSVGYPFFENETAKYKNEPKKEQVIFISQGTIGKEMSQFAFDLKANRNFKMEIVYKLHPGEYARWKEAYPWLVGSGIRVIDDESVPLYKLLAQSKVLIGVSSTVVYESLVFGPRVFLIDLPSVEYMDQLIASNVAAKISSVDELIQRLNHPHQDRVAVDQFFKPNAIENISQALNAIIASRE